MVLTIPVTADDRNLLCRGDVVAGNDGWRLEESEEVDEEFGGDVDGESSAHKGVNSKSSSNRFPMIAGRSEQCKAEHVFRSITRVLERKMRPTLISTIHQRLTLY